MQNRSRNSYIRSPRKVTAQPMGMPLRILKLAMDFLALVIMAFWPVIWPNSCAAVSSSLAFWLASPRPMFTVIFCSFGTAILFFQPKAFISAGTVSLRYFSCNRLFIAFLCLVSNSNYRLLLVQRGVAAAATANFTAVRQNRVADAGMLAATAADHHHIGNVYGRFLLDDAALDVFLRIGAGVTFHDRHMLHHHAVFLRVDGKHPATLTRILARNHSHIVALANGDSVPLGSVMPQCHELPNLRSQRNYFCVLALAQFASHRTKHARANRLARVVDQHRGVVVEADVRAILAARFLAHAYHHSLYYRALLHRALWRRLFYRSRDHVSEPRF